MPPQDPVDIIATQILFDAKAALANLKNFNENIADSGKKVAMLKNIISAVSQQIGGDLKAATAAVQRFGNAFTGINPQLIKGIGKELQLLDNIAKKSLGEMSGKTLESSTRMTLLSNAIQQMAVKGKTSIDQVVRSLQMLNASTGKSYQFGKLGFSQDDIANAGNRAKQSQVQLQAEFNKTGKAAQDAGKKAESAFGRVFSTVNAARIALGALVSMLLFQGIQAISAFFTQAITQAREFEATLYRISNAERQLSMEGVEISVKELKKGIKDIKAAFPIFSEEEIAQLVGGLATTTKELGYTGEEILKLGAAVAILNLNSTETETLLQTMGKVTNSLISPQAKSIGNLGLAFGKAKIEAKALDMQLLKTGETIDDLTEKEKQEVKYQIVLETAGIEGVDDLEKLRDMIKEAGGDFEALNEYLESNDAKLSSNKAAWNDLSVTIGQIILPFIPAVTELFKILEGAFNGAKVAIIETLVAVGTFAVVFAGAMNGSIKSTEDLANAIKLSVGTLREDLVNKFFKEMPDDAPEWFKNWGKLIKEAKETPTGDLELGVEGGEETLNTLEEIDDKIRDIAIDAQHAKEDLAVLLSQKQEDLEIKFTQKREDIDSEYVRKEEDAARDLARKVEDINKDAEREKQKVLEKARDEEHKAEEDHQLKLWELKMRYLMDLEDALHARDARQIIRLQRQYQLDKELLEKKKQQEDEERQSSLEAELDDVEQRRQDRLQDAQIEYEQKLADLAVAKARELEELNIWKAREEADLKLWYERELAEIDRQTQQKIEKLLAGYIEEQKIHEEQQEAIHQILLKYFGKNMDLVNSLVASTAAAFQSMAGYAQQAFAYSGSFQNVPTLTQQGLDQYHQSERGFRHGGTLIATRPTTATFGEVPEAVTFTPLDRRGRDVGKLFTSGDIGGGEGRIALDILLSPDLEARIVEHSMDGVAEVVSRVNRAKV